MVGEGSTAIGKSKSILDSIVILLLLSLKDTQITSVKMISHLHTLTPPSHYVEPPTGEHGWCRVEIDLPASSMSAMWNTVQHH